MNFINKLSLYPPIYTYSVMCGIKSKYLFDVDSKRLLKVGDKLEAYCPFCDKVHTMGIKRIVK